MNRYREYDSFAEVYNRHWGRFADRVVEPLDRLGLAELQRGDHVVDVCCGTGRLAAVLTERGLRVTGVDGSDEMIRLARLNAPDASFVAADARDFSLDSSAQMAISTFDSLNHILDLADLEKAFRCVADVLEPGARFVFDLNMDEAFRSQWNSTFIIDEGADLVIAESAYDPDDRLGTVHLVLMERDIDAGHWQRRDLELNQRAYTVSEVVAALASSGFGTVEASDAADVMVGGQPGRSFFVAVRDG